MSPGPGGSVETVNLGCNPGVQAVENPSLLDLETLSHDLFFASFPLVENGQNVPYSRSVQTVTIAG
jgi:hypothetical protein